MKGISLTIVIGSYGGFYFKFSKYSWRACFGWLAITLYLRTDIENFITLLIKRGSTNDFVKVTTPLSTN